MARRNGASPWARKHGEGVTLVYALRNLDWQATKASLRSLVISNVPGQKPDTHQRSDARAVSLHAGAFLTHKWTLASY